MVITQLWLLAWGQDMAEDFRVMSQLGASVDKIQRAAEV